MTVRSPQGRVFQNYRSVAHATYMPAILQSGSELDILLTASPAHFGKRSSVLQEWQVLDGELPFPACSRVSVLSHLRPTDVERCRKYS